MGNRGFACMVAMMVMMMMIIMTLNPPINLARNEGRQTCHSLWKEGAAERGKIRQVQMDTTIQDYPCDAVKSNGYLHDGSFPLTPYHPSAPVWSTPL